MKENYETCIVGSKCVLVPYRHVHVNRYHGWMQSPALLEATGSEPLTLEEEYEMQQSWRVDEKKCTFIVLQRSALLRDPPTKSGDIDDNFVLENEPAMVGDVNLFLSEEEQENPEEQGRECRIQAELDIMVAEASARGKGIGQEAACLMMLYGARKLGIRRFFCKINEDNHASLSLFRKLNFVECDYAACFRQYEYEFKRDKPDQVVDSISTFLDDTNLFTVLCASDIIKSTP